MHRPSFRSRRLWAALVSCLVISAVACDDSATEPKLPLNATPEQVAQWIQGGAEDLRFRVLPALSDRAVARRLEGHVTRLEAAFRESDVARARREIEGARRVLAAYRTAGDEVEIGVVALAIDVAALLTGLQPLPTSASAPES